MKPWDLRVRGLAAGAVVLLVAGLFVTAKAVLAATKFCATRRACLACVRARVSMYAADGGGGAGFPQVLGAVQVVVVAMPSQAVYACVLARLSAAASRSLQEPDRNEWKAAGVAP